MSLVWFACTPLLNVSIITMWVYRINLGLRTIESFVWTILSWDFFLFCRWAWYVRPIFWLAENLFLYFLSYCLNLSLQSLWTCLVKLSISKKFQKRLYSFTATNHVFRQPKRVINSLAVGKISLSRQTVMCKYLFVNFYQM